MNESAESDPTGWLGLKCVELVVSTVFEVLVGAACTSRGMVGKNFHEQKPSFNPLYVEKNRIKEVRAKKKRHLLQK
jgi:hypothetical protein